MFSRRIEHARFKELRRNLFSHSGTVALAGRGDVPVQIAGRSAGHLDRAVAELTPLFDDFDAAVAPATAEFFAAYEAIREAVRGGEVSLEELGGSLPELGGPAEIWQHLVLDRIDVEPKHATPLRLSFRAPWDIEHDYGIYLAGGTMSYAGVSV